MQKYVKSTAVVLLGNALYCVGVVLFVIPAGLITGGATGIAIAANHYWGIPISLASAIVNAAMFALGWWVLGRKFALATLVSTAAIPIFLELGQRVLGGYVLTSDPMLCALFGGLCIGTALAMVFRQGASTGGMDIPPLILNHYFRVSVSLAMYVFDIATLFLQMPYSDKTAILYGIVQVLVYTMTLDKMQVAGTGKMQVKIISQKAEAIKNGILQEVDRGVTMLRVVTGYLNAETEMIFSVVSPRETYKIEKLIYGIDPEAFVVISKVSEVKGRGFTQEKKYLE